MKTLQKLSFKLTFFSSIGYFITEMMHLILMALVAFENVIEEMQFFRFLFQCSAIIDFFKTMIFF